MEYFYFHFSMSLYISHANVLFIWAQCENVLSFMEKYFIGAWELHFSCFFSVITYYFKFWAVVFNMNFLVCCSSMNMNLLAFLADLFNVMEIHPAKCVCFPGSPQGNLSLKDRKYCILGRKLQHKLDFLNLSKFSTRQCCNFVFILRCIS
jgi:hypothetical protein